MILHVVGYPGSGKSSLIRQLCQASPAPLSVVDPPNEYDSRIRRPRMDRSTQEWELASWLDNWLADLACMTRCALPPKPRENAVVIVECSPALHAMLPAPNASIWLGGFLPTLVRRISLREGFSEKQSATYVRAHVQLARSLGVAWPCDDRESCLLESTSSRRR